jgi:hypothetical protein
MNSTPDSSGKLHAVLITIGAACVLLALYVATWPFIELKLTDHKVVSLSKGITVHVAPPPPWITALYRPLHRLRDAGGRANGNLVRTYWEWWQKRLWTPTRVKP